MNDTFGHHADFGLVANLTGARLDPPHDAFAMLAEASAIEALAGQGGGMTALLDWVAEAGPTLPLNRLRTGFGLGASETALMAFLFAAALSADVMRGVESKAGPGGLPFWLAAQFLPRLRPDALARAAPLVHFSLIDLDDPARRGSARLHLSGPLFDRFCGAKVSDPVVASRIVPCATGPVSEPQSLVAPLRQALSHRGANGLPPAVFASGSDADMVAGAFAALGMVPHILNASDVPPDPDARDHLARLWSRDAALDAGALIILTGDGQDMTAVASFADRVMGHVALLGGGSAPPALQRGLSILPDPSATEVTTGRWSRALGPRRSKRLGPALSRIARQFRLTPAEITAVVARAGDQIDTASTAGDAAQALWHHAGRATLAAPLPGVTMVEPAMGWDGIVLAPAIEAHLRRVETHVRHAAQVFDDWGFAARMGGRGRGVAALFSGPSGTGKTLAAEVLARSLDLRMMMIDLSQIISKYVGETSKNIAAAFDQAERSGAVMVWNEGDAIWGARGAVGNATDRHVNAEVGDLLQRIEAFSGFTIVTTNLRHAIDPAFLRRFRFMIDFPMPSAAERLRLWQQVFPSDAPVDRLNWAALAPLALSGGSIRNIALGAAFLAAGSDRRIGQAEIAAELAEEMRKQNLSVPHLDWGAA